MEHVTKRVKSFIDFLFSETDETWNEEPPVVNSTTSKASNSDTSKFVLSRGFNQPENFSSLHR